MAKVEIEHACGHSETHQIISRGGDRAEWLETQDCFECRQAKRLASNASKSVEAGAYAESAGWPKLSGSEKQIAWAETIRYEFACAEERERALKTIHERRDWDDGLYVGGLGMAESMRLGAIRCDPMKALYGEDWKNVVSEDRAKHEAILRRYVDAENEILGAAHLAELSSRWWIDHRDELSREAFAKSQDRLRRTHALIAAGRDWRLGDQDRADSEALAAELASESACVLAPEKPTKGLTPVDLAVDEKSISVSLPRKDDDLYDVAKPRGTWFQGRWSIPANDFQSVADVAAEIATLLLRRGFRVQVPNGEIKRKVAEADFAWMPMRRCMWDRNAFVVRWEFGNDALYQTLHRIGGRYRQSDRGMRLSLSSWEELDTVCEDYGIAMTPGARSQIEGVRAKYSGGVSVVPAELPAAPPGPGPRPNLDPETAAPDQTLEDQP